MAAHDVPRSTFLFAGIVLLLLIACGRWIAAHPQPMYWDEANYVNQAIGDHEAFNSGGLEAVAKRLMYADAVRPPAYRILVLPVTLFVRPTLTLLRILSLVCCAIAALLLTITASRVGSWPAACVAALCIFATPGILSSSAWYGTEFALYLATALLLWSLVGSDRPFALVTALALGLLAKSTFVLIAAPVCLAALWHVRGNRSERLRLLGSGIAAVLLAGLWWSQHVHSALAYAQYGRTFVRAASPSFLHKLETFLVNGTGVLPLLAIAPAVVLGIRHIPRDVRLMVLLAAIPLQLVAFASPVFVARHFAAAWLPLALIVAAGLSRSRGIARFAAVLLMLHALLLALLPTTILGRTDQTDWTSLTARVDAPAPTISFLGGWPSLSPPEIRYAWIREGREARAVWLWRFEEGAIRWPEVMQAVESSDAVLVVPPGVEPRFVSEIERKAFALDNRYNAQLIRRLEGHTAFRCREPFAVGTRDPVDAVLYRKC